MGCTWAQASSSREHGRFPIVTVMGGFHVVLMVAALTRSCDANTDAFKTQVMQNAPPSLTILEEGKELLDLMNDNKDRYTEVTGKLSHLERLQQRLPGNTDLEDKIEEAKVEKEEVEA